ncbi:P-loop ATPase, Sll1717 family [Mangrovihabitans endophyticus]|uniref:Uncharacterized protein n=1 Tax=Mangrovihabitans endophyticus TaxID=1751298 RepID=A0A8J3C7X6_9ACTN|nr:hypothetical protein [Mangrovihabitans endophyticus]GGL18193.1 hypothetical protein GCM10012284_60970 [Mangrovihabitans endophyticus]
MRNLNEVESFGGTAAEDDDIERFFVETPAFSLLTSGRRHLVVGRKGSGKTALYLAVRNSAGRESSLSVGLTFKQYPWAAHLKYASTEVDSTERFVSSWLFLMLIETFSSVIKAAGPGLDRHQRRALDDVSKFLRHNYGTTDLDFRHLFPAGGLRLDKIDVKPEVLKNSLGGFTQSRTGESLGATLTRINDWLFAKLEVLNSKTPKTYVLFDELDLGFEPEKAEYLDRVTGLLLAMRYFVSRITRNGIPVHPVVFLRTDIFDLLHFGDKNKIVNAEMVELAWHDQLERTGASLKHLLDWRIKEELEVKNLDEAWGKAFDDQLTRGTQHKFQHMTFRTFLRPRDVIQFANLALSAAKSRGPREGVPNEDLRISNSDVKAARVPYSNYFRRELDDEIAAVEPAWQSYLEVLRIVGAAKFERSDYEAAFEVARRKFELKLSIEDSLSLLYQFSILGFERAVTGAGLIYQFRYIDPSVPFESDAAYFYVHRGLKETLGLTETQS